jgi:hypothetical protein
LDTRLAEIDRKLREIQVDLDPGREAAPSQATAEAPDVSAAAPQASPDPPQQSPDPPPQGPPDPPAPAPKGRSGPLASLLQRSARRPPPPPPAPIRPRNPTSGSATAVVSTEMHAKLLSAMRDLLDAYGWTLQQLPVAADPVRPGEPEPVALSVGPFADTEAVRGFEQALLRIPGVSEVVLRGYEGEDRAMFDVRISDPNA